MKIVAIILAVAMNFAIVLGTMTVLAPPAEHQCKWHETAEWSDYRSEYQPGWNCTGGGAGHVIGAAVISLILSGVGIGAYATYGYYNNIEKKLINEHDRYVIGAGRE